MVFCNMARARSLPGVISYTMWKALPLTGNAPVVKLREKEDWQKNVRFIFTVK